MNEDESITGPTDWESVNEQKMNVRVNLSFAGGWSFIGKDRDCTGKCVMVTHKLRLTHQPGYVTSARSSNSYVCKMTLMYPIRCQTLRPTKQEGTCEMEEAEYIQGVRLRVQAIRLSEIHELLLYESNRTYKRLLLTRFGCFQFTRTREGKHGLYVECVRRR